MTAADAESEQRIANLDGVPLTLLPVRLETRYIGPPTDPRQLRVRVYPDQIHLDAHRPGLTAGEIAAGQLYWRTRWDPSTAGQAWAELIRGVRPTRALWIVRALTPTNPVGDPAGPQFPDLPTEQSELDRPLAIRAMPTRWVALGYDAKRRQILRRWFDHTVAADLLASAAITDGPPLTGDAAVDGYLGWTSDFSAAVRAGMAVIIKSTDLADGHRLVDGFARLVVLGIDWTTDGGHQLDALLGIHEVTDGLSFLPPGTPTNNIDSAPAAGGAAAALDPLLAPPVLNPNWSAGTRLAAALGTDPKTMARLPGAAAQTAQVAADLVDATWSGTLGYFATHLLAPLVNDRNLAETRRHAVAHLAPLGPLPTLRIGAQPLGILPVLPPVPPDPSADRYAADLAGLLAKLRPMWNASIRRVPRLVDADPDQELEAVLLAVLRRSPWTNRVWYRKVFGPLLGFQAGGIGRAQQFQAGLRSLGFLDALDLKVQPRIVPFGIHDQTRHLRIPLLGQSTDGAPPDLSYLTRIHDTTTKANGRGDLARSAPKSVLDALVTFAAMQEIDLAAARLVRRAHATTIRTPIAWRTTEVSGIGALADPSPLIRATTKLLELGGRSPAAEVARLQIDNPSDRDLVDLRAFQVALDRLAAAEPSDVDPAMRAYLGACSHRLDAWLTSLATRQLAAVRTAHPTGTHVGGFGYVEGLLPELTPDSQGYLLGPSLAHAATAAILRSGYLAQLSTGTESLDVDLTSTRVQQALDIMRGMREGVPLTVLLGYKFERSLRDADLSPFILPTRQRYPLRTPPPPDNPGGPVETTPPNNVTDAATLLEAWAADRGDVIDDFRTDLQVPATDPRLIQLTARIDELADTYDAIADVVLAEAVHQIVKGQPERAQAATRFLDRQELPVEPEVTASPRTSTGYVQRCVLAIASAEPGAAWRPTADPRADAEPRLNAWLADILGEPGSWVFAGRAVAADGSELAPGTVPILDLALSPLSLVVAAGNGSGDQPSELEERVARRMAELLSPGADAAIELVADPGAGGGRGLAEFIALASTIRRFLQAARPADQRIFDLPDSAADSGLDATDLRRRADTAEAGLRSAASALDHAIAAAAPAADLADALETLSRAGVPGAVTPLGFAAAPAEHTLDFARDAAATARSRLDQLTALTTDATTDPAAHHQRRIAITLGAGFPVMGSFTIPHSSQAHTSLQPAQQSALLRGDPLAPMTWMTRMSRVRPDLDKFWQILVAAEVVTGYDPTGFAIAQLPHRSGTGWAALPFPDGSRPDAEVAVAVHAPSGTDGPIAALSVDGWTEQIPLPTETAGLSFHYDAPSNRAPQTAIVAVPPQVADHPWTLNLVADTVIEAFDLARIRGVTLTDLPAVGAVLPALYVPFDPGGNVPSINLDLLAEHFGPPAPVLGKD